MQRQLHELSKQELIAVIQDYQEMFSELENLRNIVAFRDVLNDILYKERPGWKIHERHWSPKPAYISSFSKASYTDAELVEIFINTTQSWYVDENNDMFGWRDKVQAELIRCLKDNDEPNSEHYQLVYADMKFSSEWIGPEGIFVEIKGNENVVCKTERAIDTGHESQRH